MTGHTGGYYHSYRNRLIDFLVPAKTNVLTVGGPESFTSGQSHYDAIVVSDVLGHTYDIQELLEQSRTAIAPDGRLIITQYSRLWEPLLRLASVVGLRKKHEEENWITMSDLENFLALTGWETLVTGRKVLLPIYVPLLTPFMNRVMANLPLIRRFNLINYAVARPASIPEQRQASVSVVVPARNEAGTIHRIIDEMPIMGSSTEIIFVEGNSTDNTQQVIETAIAEYPGAIKVRWAKQTGEGKGDAVRKGFSIATGDIFMIYDADMTVPPEELPKFYRALVSGQGDFISGSRLVYPMEKQSMRTLNYIANKLFGLAFSWLLDQRLKDTLCGTKALWRRDYEAIARGRSFFGDFDPFGDFDLLFGAAKLNRKIIEVPVHYRDRTYGITNISRFSHGWLLLQMVIFAAKKMKFI